MGLRQKLDYLENMGVNGLWISGVQMNTQGRDTRYTPYHMYHPTDFWRCDPTAGTFQELKDLIDDCHSRGIYVILDVVVNHMADLGGLPNGDDDKWYWSGGNDSYTWWDSNRRHRGAFDRLDWFHHNGTINNWDASPENLLGQFKGTDDLATDRADVQAELDRAFKNLISATDCDGFRVDAIKHVEYNWCKKWADDMRKHAASLGKSDFLLFGELFSYDNGALASWCNDEGYSFNSALFFPMANTIKSVFKDSGGTGQLTDQRDNISMYGEGANRLVAFIDNHDVNRISLEMGGGYDDDVAKLKPAMTFLYTAMPVPLLYYGTEHCFDQGGHYNGSSKTTDNPDDGDHQRECMFDRGFQPGPASGNKFDQAASPLYSHIAAINNARKNYKSLTRGSFSERWEEGSAGAYAYSRSYGDEESLVALNTSDGSRSISPNVDSPDGTEFENVLNPGEKVTSSGGSISFSLSGKESKIFVAGASSQITINRAYHWPFDGEVDPGDDLWINVESSPVGGSTNAYVVYTTDGGTTWDTAVMSVDSSITSFDGWHVNMGSFPSETVISYAACVQGEGGEAWANNGGENYTVNVNAGGTPAEVAWTPVNPDNCFGSTVEISYTPNDGVLSGAAQVELVYGFFFVDSTNWAGVAMTESAGVWSREISVPVDCLRLEFVFNDGTDWDNNNNNNWGVDIEPCDTEDSNGDGIPDEWASKYGFNPTGASVANLDSDGDGVNNLSEYVAGTDPTSAASQLALSPTMRSGGGVTIAWPVADTGRRYTLLRSTNLVSGFQVVQSNVVGVVPLTQYIDGSVSNKMTCFYKVRAEVPQGMVNESVSVSASPAGGGFSTAGILVTLNVSGVNVVSSTYTVQGGSTINYNNGATITFGADMEVGEYRTLTLRGATLGGLTDEEVYIFNKISAPQNVTWVGRVVTDPASGQWDTNETLSISFETAPIGAAASAGIVYSLDGGNNWSGGGLTKTGSNSSNDIWSITMPAQTAGSSLEFALVATDNGDTETWDSNGGANYRITVNSDFTPGSTKPYSTNPTLGKYRSAGITIDGANTSGEWTDDMLIALDVANDDPRTLGDNWTTHEAPIDFTHLWACWDNNNLYVAWQMVDVTDVIDGANAGSGDPINRNDGILVWMMLDTETGGCTNDMWGKTQTWGGPDQPDYMMYMAGSLWQGYISHQSDGVFPVDEGEYYACSARSITYDNGALLAAPSLWGVRDCDNRNDGESALENFKDSAHTRTDRDSFYEVKIPLAALGLTKADLEANGIGVMVGAGGNSAMDTIPNDPATTDTPGVEVYNSSFEWADTDHFTAPFARIAAP
ncbi:MAG: alpha-amylase family glycosyl hydrolase [Kiritimatiellae bacterium]|nr:alpha-amylase family glycosyl hydrolase [Kiritimatiellia bacterium]